MVSIALVEDSKTDAQLFISYLRDSKVEHSFQFFSSISEFERREDTFDIVFCDINLADSSGTDTIHRLTQTCKAKIILISGMAATVFTAKEYRYLLDCGAANVIDKALLNTQSIDRELQEYVTDAVSGL